MPDRAVAHIVWRASLAAGAPTACHRRESRAGGDAGGQIGCGGIAERGRRCLDRGVGLCEPAFHPMQRWYDCLSSSEVKAVASILMGAAHADGSVTRDEAGEVRKILEELFGEKPLPDFLVDHLLTFNPRTFDLATTCAGIRLQGPEERRGLLSLLARIIEADGIYDLAEDSYLRRVAREIGAEPSEYHDLVIERVE
jgi:uncharacterized tellurite resistance protein B-like protein